MTRFKEALLEQLLDHQRQIRAARPATGSRHLRRAPAFAAAAAGVIAVAAVTTWAALPARSPHPGRPVPAAYTVTRSDDGIVTFTVRRVVDAAAATRDLRAAGIKATVLNASAPGACPTSLDSVPHASTGLSIGIYGLDGDTIRLSSRLLGDGPLLIVVAAADLMGMSSDSVVLQAVPIAGPAPDCVSVSPLPVPTDTRTRPAPDLTPTR
jgi:hypothetical protein